MLNNSVTPEKKPFNTQFTTRIILNGIVDLGSFENINIASEELKVSYLTGLSIESIDVQIMPAPTQRYMDITADFTELIRISKAKYESLHSSVINQTPPDFKHFLPFRISFAHIVYNLLKYIIWRKNLIANIVDVPSTLACFCKWQLDGIEGTEIIYNSVQEGTNSIDVEVEVKNLAKSDFSDFAKLYKSDGSGVPLHKELLSEAENLLSNNLLRSAMVLICTAIEVGTKSLISYKAPEADWLLENIPSPDLLKIHKDYIPKLIGMSILNDEEYELLRKLVNVRNKIVHTGKLHSMNFESVEKYYFFVKRALYRIDFHMGFSWADQIIYPPIDFILPVR